MSAESSSTVFENAKKLITRHSRRAGELMLWACMDDRPISGLAHTPYRQIGGGVHGAASDFLILAEMIRPGTFLDRAGGKYTQEEARTTIPDLAKKAHLQLLPSGLFAVLHDYCAAEGSAADANTNVVQLNQDLLFKRTQELYPDAD